MFINEITIRIYMFQDTPFKFSLYDSEYYVKSLEIHKNVLDNVSCNDLH